MEKKMPRIGVGIIVMKEGKILLGERKGSHHAGVWSVPGGHLEFKETLEECARREVMEEVGITIKNVRKGPYTEDVFDDEQHYISFFMIAEYDRGKVNLCEPEKCNGWDWFAWDDFPENHTVWLKKIRAEGFNPFTL